ncbi:type III secretion system protein VscX [Vibrio parahaemolyticus]|uniref:type III secretion system protein VscX n=1 Tax=Vibrio parahaemolyticus TaxID=670 RepID=UPI0015DDCF97|nr:type III secretion system protein VscX [Vibrio parahaemolyticus]MBE3842807.1 type III secretion system protein VscX [Vibrio parahaemolyticus]MBE3945510.1 type III secretion system protein VscX [Vibrio parahaemolyticus]MBE4117276.1 type III secretion system protein VscX [Vibrio parahaemolyticus]MBE4778594.1 type III secretion system protein VscX [Vibrio parahaemolyticus]MEA5287605.1 type III secretion system protein VscX [Vibrio parahaemolyticus]
MTRVSTLNVGIEAFTHVSHGEVDTDFPKRFQLLPDGQAVATHLEKLYDLRPSDQYLLALANPKLNHCELLRPEKYRQQFDNTLARVQQLAQESGSANLAKAAETLQSTQLDQRYLTMALNLLIQV